MPDCLIRPAATGTAPAPPTTCTTAATRAPTVPRACARNWWHGAMVSARQMAAQRRRASGTRLHHHRRRFRVLSNCSRTQCRCACVARGDQRTRHCGRFPRSGRSVGTSGTADRGTIGQGRRSCRQGVCRLAQTLSLCPSTHEALPMDQGPMLGQIEVDAIVVAASPAVVV